MVTQGDHGAGIEVCGFVQVVKRKVDDSQHWLTLDDMVHDGSELLVVHDMVSIALVDHDSKVACKSFVSTVVVRSGRINLKKVGEMTRKSMGAFGAILVDLEFPVDRIGRFASVSAYPLARAGLQLEDLDVILGDRLHGRSMLRLP